MGISKSQRKSTFKKMNISKLLKNLLEVMENRNLRKATFNKIGVSLGDKLQGKIIKFKV